MNGLNYSTIFSISFRPFFILAALIAFLNPLLWIAAYLGLISLPLNSISALFWHGHEMIFAFCGALIAGFILTASANWTKSKPYQGRWLALLTLIWLVERISYFLPIGNFWLIILMNLFFPLLTIMLLLKLHKFPKQRNIFIPILLGLTLSKIAHSSGYIFQLDFLETNGKDIASGLIRFIILLIAGRVIPFFSRKRIEGLTLDLPKWVNPSSLFPIALLIYPWPESTPKLVIACILSFAILANTLRLTMWKPLKAMKVPILFILHIGIAFIILGLILELISLYISEINFSQAPLHALMAGGLGAISIGIMSRVSLGHTGRVIKADKWTVTAYLVIVGGSIVRIAVPLFFQSYYVYGLYLASTLWSFGFLVFLIRYFKVLIMPRPDGKIY